MYEHVGKFISKVLPWPAEGEKAYVNLHWATNKLRPDGKNFWWGGRGHLTPADLISTLAWVAKQPSTTDLYVCMSSQAQADEKIDSRGVKYFNAKRAAFTAVKLRSFFIDVDVKEGAYPDTAAALVALQGFMSVMGLPLPTATVATGSGGFHVHWALAEGIPAQEWAPLAKALANATRKHGLMCDVQCTIDAARILRIPETRNFKWEPPQPTYMMSDGDHVTLEQMTAVLAPYMTSPVVSALPPSLGALPSNMAPPTDSLGSGVEQASAPLYIDEVAKQCAFVSTALTTGGRDYPEPLWFLSLSIASFCDDGRTQAHRMSLGHPSYTIEETNAKYDQVLTARQERNVGWPSCQRIEETGHAGCATCPMKPFGKSPLHHGYKQQQANVSQPLLPGTVQDLNANMPKGYAVTPEGYIFNQSLDESGNIINVPVMVYPILDAWLQDDPGVLHFTSLVYGGKRSKIEAPLMELSSKDGMAKVLGRQGIVLKDKAQPFVREFIVAWIQKLQQSKDAIVSSVPFGWTEAGGGKVEGFTYAGRVWSPTGDRPAAMVDAELASMYSPTGDLVQWKKAAKIITDQRRPGLDAILGASFGAPLMRFTGHPGAMLNAYSSDSGIGKTTTMKIAQAVWGDPARAIQGLKDTSNSVLGKMGKLKVLPMFWDELKTDANMKNFVVMMFEITGGIEKSRMRSDTTLRPRGSWKTLMISACNDSLMDHVIAETAGTNAGIYRLFEYRVAPAPEKKSAEGVVTRQVSKLDNNFGQAGLVFAQFIGANHERVSKEVEALYDKIVLTNKANTEERFWMAAIATTVIGAMYANELGLTDIDVPGLYKFLQGVLAAMRKEITDSPVDMRNQASVSNIIAQFLNAMKAKHTLVTNKVHQGAGKPVKGAIQIKSDPNRLDGIYVHKGTDDGIMRISSTYLSNWLRDNKYSRHAFKKALESEFGMKHIKGRLGSGTEFASATEYILEIDLNNPTLQGFIE